MPPLPLLQAARRFAALRPEERRFAARAWLAAPVVRASLAVIGLKATLRWVEAARPAVMRGNAEAPVGVATGGALVGSAFRAHVGGVAGGQCLPRSVVQYLLHGRDGVPARLVVGVKRSDQGTAIEAHAWVEAQVSGRGRVAEDGFEPLYVTGGTA